MLSFGIDFALQRKGIDENGWSKAWRHAVGSSEKRKYRRLALKLDLRCRTTDSSVGKSYTGYTVNVCPGGLYFETRADAFKPGNLLKVEMSIPPTAGMLEFGGRIAGFARVLRTCNACTNPELSPATYGVALEFCQPPKLCT